MGNSRTSQPPPGDATEPQRRTPWLLIAGFIVVAALIAAAGYWVWLQQARAIRSQAESTLAAVAELKSDQITGWLDERRGDARVISSDHLLAGAAARLADGTAGTTTWTTVQSHLAAVQREYAYVDVVLLSAAGSVLVRAPITTDHPIGARARQLADEALLTGQVQTSDLYLGPDGHIRLETAAPLLAIGSERRRAGVVILHMDPGRFLYPLVQSWPLPNSSGETLLVERRGDRVLFLNELRFRKGTALRLSEPLDNTALPAAAAVRGRRGVVEGVDYRGVPVFAAVQPVTGTDWFIIAKLDSGEILGPLRVRAWVTAGSTAILVLLAGAGALVLWRGRETRTAVALAASQSRFRTLFESMTEGVAMNELVYDAAGAPVDYRILDINPAFSEQTGLVPEKVHDKLATDAYGASDPPFMERYAQAVNDGEPRRFEVFFEPLDRHFDIAIVPQDTDRFATIFQDVTARKQADAALRANERKFRETIQALDEGYYSVTLDAVLLDHNPAFNRILGIDPDADLRGMLSPDFWWDAADRATYVEQLRKEDVIRDYLVNAKAADGSRLILLVSAHLVHDDRGEVVRIDGSIVDFTARKAAEDEIARLNADLEQRVLERTAQLDAANKELEAFAYSVSHDLRAPLRHISGFSSLLAEREEGSLDDKSRHYLDTISRSVREMGVLIDDLLQFSRTARAELRIGDVDMGRALSDALEPLRQDIAERDIEWSIGALPRVIGDQALLRQVWANLLGNAVKYTRGRAPARIEVGTLDGDSENGEDVFFVRDNGVGFDMAFAHKLFGVFQRLHAASEFEGTGIGLANVKRIISRLGGRVWAEAELDKGATFFFSLPRRKEATG